MSQDLEALHQLHDISVAPPSTGRLANGARALLRRLLRPILQKQADYNAANARVATQVAQEIEKLTHQIENLESTLRRLSDGVGWLPEAHTNFRAETMLRLEELERLYAAIHAEQRREIAEHAEALQGIGDALREKLADLSARQEQALALLRSERARARDPLER